MLVAQCRCSLQYPPARGQSDESEQREDRQDRGVEVQGQKDQCCRTYGEENNLKDPMPREEHALKETPAVETSEREQVEYIQQQQGVNRSEEQPDWGYTLG